MHVSVRQSSKVPCIRCMLHALHVPPNSACQRSRALSRRRRNWEVWLLRSAIDTASIHCLLTDFTADASFTHSILLILQDGHSRLLCWASVNASALNLLIPNFCACWAKNFSDANAELYTLLSRLHLCHVLRDSEKYVELRMQMKLYAYCWHRMKLIYNKNWNKGWGTS